MSNSETLCVPERIPSLMFRVLLEMKMHMDKLAQINQDLISTMRTVEIQRFHEQEDGKSKTFRKINTHRLISDRQPTPVAFIRTIQSANSSCSEDSIDRPNNRNDSEYIDDQSAKLAPHVKMLSPSVSFSEMSSEYVGLQSQSSVVLVSSYCLDVSDYEKEKLYASEYFKDESEELSTNFEEFNRSFQELSSLYLMSTHDNENFCKGHQREIEEQSWVTVSTSDTSVGPIKLQTLFEAQREFEENWKRLHSFENNAVNLDNGPEYENIPASPKLKCKHRWSCLSCGRRVREMLDATSNKKTTTQFKNGLVQTLVKKWEQLSEHYKK